MRRTSIPREAVGVYWFVDDEVARNLVGARERVREFDALGFTEVWLAERYLVDIEDAPTALTAPSYRRFLEVVFDEADDLGLRVIPFVIPCCLDGLEAARFDHVLCATSTDGMLDFGPAPEGWASLFEPVQCVAYRLAPTDLGPTIVTSSVRALDIALDVQPEGGRLRATFDRAALAPDDELFVALRPPAGSETGPPDVTAPDFAARLDAVVRFHDTVGAGHPSYAGLAFDEPNIADPAPPDEKRLRTHRFYWSAPLAERLRQSGVDLDGRLWAMTRPDDELGWGLRYAYYATMQDVLMEVIDGVMQPSPVPLVGTHDWSGDRDRALYNTFDQLQFTKVRSFGATDISGPQWQVDYAAVEPLLAYAQKEAYGRERAMLMTDYWRERTDFDWLTYTCERHAALGVDYMLLHAYGRIVDDPPSWTRTESWAVYREPHGLERYTARMRRLSRLRDYHGDPNVLVVFPRLARLAHVGDRFVTREWAAVMFALHRAHYSPLTISQADFDRLEFDGPTVRWGGRSVNVIVLPYAGYIDDDQLTRLLAFHEAGGHLVFTKPHDWFGTGDGRPSPYARARLGALFGIDRPPVVRRFQPGDSVTYDGVSYPAFALPDGLSQHDDAWCDFDGASVLSAENQAGGRAALLGFELAALIHGADMHDVLGTGGVALLDRLLADMTPRAFSCTTGDGSEDYDVIGLVRRRGDDVALTAHRVHDRRSLLKVGRTTVVVPSGRAGDHPNITGVNVFVDHVEEGGVVVYNPLQDVLTEVDVGHPIREAVTSDERHRWCWFEGAELRLALPPGRTLRFASVEPGSRDPALPAALSLDGGRILSALVPVDDPATVVVRVKGEERLTLRMSLAAAHGETVAAVCQTSGVGGKVRQERVGNRIAVEIEVETIPTLENDVVVTQR